MEFNKKLEQAINDQIQAEMYSSYLYLSMSAYFEAVNWSGFAHWMRVQTHEEQEHAMKLYKYVVERGGRVKLQAIQQPPVDFESVLAVAKMTYEHEQKVSGLIYNLYELAGEVANTKYIVSLWCDVGRCRRYHNGCGYTLRDSRCFG